MKYAEIIIEVDETKLTDEQQGQANAADKDISFDHPLDYGVNNLRDKLLHLDDYFNYLGKGCEAVTLNIR